MGQALLLAGPGILLATILTGSVLQLLYGWGWYIALMFGAIISATDPVAIVSIHSNMKRLSSSTTLEQASKHNSRHPHPRLDIHLHVHLHLHNQFKAIIVISSFTKSPAGNMCPKVTITV